MKTLIIISLVTGLIGSVLSVYGDDKENESAKDAGATLRGISMFCGFGVLAFKLAPVTGDILGIIQANKDDMAKITAKSIKEAAKVAAKEAA